jgi:transposase
MSRKQKDPLRPLSQEEHHNLKHLSRSTSQPAVHVIRAKALLAVETGWSYTEAAEMAGYRMGDTVAKLVNRFNQEGMSALQPGHGGGTPSSYGVKETERILTEVRRVPEPKAEGTASWSLSLLKASLRQAPDGLPQVSTYTIWCVLREAGYSWQKNRTWCETGKVLRKRKRGVVTVRDADAVAKKN